MLKSSFELKATVAALALTVSSATQAVVVDWGVHDSAEFGSAIYSGGSSTIDDVYLFSLTGSYNGLVTSVTNDAPPVFNMNDGVVALWQSNGDSDYTNDTLITLLNFDSTAVNTTWSLPTGDYFYQVTGTIPAGAKGGSYLISSSILPVPEPEMYAMLLAGFGLIGFSLRRRAV